MGNKLNFPQIVLGVLLVGVFLTGCFLIPWRLVDWGRLQLSSPRTITVTGEAKTQEKSQIATFDAGVSAVNDNKETAINQVNEKIKAIIDAVKAFGIKDEDIKTQSLSVYQSEETYYEEGVQKSRPGQWRVSNTITVTLRDIEKASDLADLLTRSGATNVYGPNFALEETQQAEESLLDEAIKNAKSKAEIIAKSSGGKLGKIISVSEGYQQPTITRFAPEGYGGGGPPIEPGTATVQKTVTVIFELK